MRDASEFFKPVREITTTAARRFLAEHEPGSYYLIDVRQPDEYEAAHMPGARLMPLSDIKDLSTGLDRTVPSIVYCRSGNRSRAAAEFFEHAGFADVVSMSGGINAYEGAVASGHPEAGMAYFPREASHAELAALAWVLEDGTERFYRSLLDDGHRGSAVIESLAAAEGAHKARLAGCCELLGSGGRPPAEMIAGADGNIMEGGVRVSDALMWAKGRAVRETVELMMALEANAYDLYLKMFGRMEDPQAKGIFKGLAEDEKAHIEKLAGLLAANY